MGNEVLKESKPAQQQGQPASAGQKSRATLFLRIGVAVILIVVILRLIDFNTVVQIIAGANLWMVLLLFPLMIFDRALMAYKWAELLRTRGIGISNWEAFKIYMSSTFVGTVLPTGVGSDVFRAVRTTMGGSQMNVVTASIVLERVLGMLGMSTLALMGMAALADDPTGQIRPLFVAVAAFFAAVAGGLFLSINPRTYTLMARLTSRFHDFKPVRLFMKFHGAYVDMSQYRTVLFIFYLLSILEQAVGGVMIWVGAQALGFDTPLIYFLALLPLSRFITLLPISIGGIGVTEGTYVFVFALAGLSAADSLSLALLMRVTGWIMLMPAGLIFLYDSARFKRARGPVIG
jgi:uncharacterized protein (TIRG00374 family)